MSILIEGRRADIISAPDPRRIHGARVLLHLDDGSFALVSIKEAMAAPVYSPPPLPVASAPPPPPPAPPPAHQPDAPKPKKDKKKVW